MKAGWVETALSDLSITFTDGNWIESKDQSPEGIRLVQTGNVGFGFFKNRKYKARYINEDTFSRLRCEEIFAGDILVSRLPDPPGRACIIPQTIERMITAVDCTIIRLDKKKISPEFFNYFSQSREYLANVEALCTGTTRKRISRKNLGKINIPTSSLDEQKRIVEVLDAAFAKIDRLEAIAKRQVRNNDEIITQVINQTFNEPKDHWHNVSLDQVCEIKSVLVDPREKQCLDLYHVGAGNIISNSTDLVDVLTAREEGLKSGKFPFDTSMVLYSKIRPYLRKVAIPDFEGICSADIYPLTPHKQLLDKEFLFYLLLSKRFTDYAISGSGRAGMPKVNRKHLFQYEFNIPTLDEQKVLVKKWNKLRLAISAKKKVIIAKQNSLTELRQSILAKAFTGELVEMFPTKTYSESVALVPANDNHTDHAGVIAYADSYFRNAHSRTFKGKTSYEKVAQAAEAIAGIDLGRQAIQWKRGPTDNQQREAVEALAQKEGYFTFESTGGKGFKLARGRNFNELRLNFERKFQEQIPALDRFLRVITNMDTRDVEVLSTVHTAWNNYIIEGQTPDDEQIVTAARENWHEEKMNIARPKFFDAIKALRDESLIPTGQGKYVGKSAGASFDF